MTLKLYFPISVGLFVAVTAAGYFSSVPVMPLAVILLAGETLLGFQLEEHKVPRTLLKLFRPPKHSH